MVRETRHLWVGNLPDSIREDRIRDHFKRYGRVQSVKLLGRKEDEGGGLCATVSFMDIKSAAKAHHSEQKLEDRLLTTEYHEPPSIPSTNSSIHYSSRYSSNEEVVGFERAPHFYEGGGREGRDYLSRRYHAEPAIPRSRRQDARIYRNGPYSALISPTTERSRSDHHGRSWGYESPRYSTSSVPAPQEISYPEERRESSSLHSSKKHSKSRSGSDSASSASSRSRSSSPSSRSSSCSSATSSPASEKSCSTHSQHGSLRGNAGSVNASSINSSSPAVHNEDRRPLAICVRNLPARSSDTSLKDGLYHEYKKHGKVTWVKVVGQGSDRYAVVCFKKTEDVDKALQVSHDKLFFGCKIDVAPYQGYDVDDNEFSFVCRPFEADQDEFHPKATRTLFIGNLEKDFTMQEIRKHFDQFGEILDIDIKKQGTTSSYAFCQYTDIASVVRAIRSLDGEHLGSTRVKLGFGKSLQTNCVWVDGIAESVSEKYLSQHFSQFGPVSHVVIDRSRGQALISFEQITYAQQAVKEMRGVMLRGRKLQIDYASRECQDAFYDHMDKQTNQHPNYDTSVAAGVTNSSGVRGFETPSSSSSSCGGGSASGRYAPSSRNYPQAGQAGSRYHSSPSQQRSSRQRYTEYPSDYPQDRRTSYRSYEDVISVEDGEGRHKERVDIEECQSSGEEGVARRKCKHRRSDGDSSRPGTPLCDERPEPTEPRRPRERTQDPLSLPLPRFATQVLPPPSPPSSDDSQPSPPSPEWEERLRSLDEKYRKWSGSRTNPTRPDPTSVRLRHRLLALDPHDLQPSDIVKSLLAKRSVFDEDLKRLENFGEKYEPKEFVPGRVLRSPGSPVQGKGLQYPFPSHPADPSRPPTSTINTSTTPTPTTPTTSNNPPSFTKPQPQPQQQQLVPIKPKTEKTEIKKDITSSLLVSSIKPKPFRRDSEPSEARRKSREEAPEITKSLESAVKKEDTSDCDKVKDVQVSERRKSTADKRRNSIDTKDLSIDSSDKLKDTFDKKESRRASCDSVESDSRPKDPRKHVHESVDIPPNSETDKSKKLDSEFRKDTELGSKNPGNIDIDRKKDIFGVNSEKDRRRKESVDGSSDNLKHKKVPETNKCDSLAIKTDSDETKMTDIDKRKEDSGKSKDKKEQLCSDRERRRDSMDSDAKKPPKLDEYPKHKDNKLLNDIKTIRKDSELEFTSMINKKENDKEIVKNKDGEKKKNCETEISKEHSLFKKVFGFTDSLRNKDNNKKETNFPKTDMNDKSKEKKELLNDTKSKKDLDMDNVRHKSSTRKSPDSQESVRHKDSEKKKNFDVDRKKKDHDINSDDYLTKDYDVNYHNKRKVIERCLTKDGLNVNNDCDHITKFSKDHDKKKDYLYEDLKRNEDLDGVDNPKQKDNENKHDTFTKDHKKKDCTNSDMICKSDKRINSDCNYESDKYFDNERKKDDHMERFKENKGDLNNDVKLKHSDKHDRKRHQEFIENSKFKDEKKKDDLHERHRKKDNDFENIKQKDEPTKTNDRKKDHFENNKFRDMDDAVRKRKDLESIEQTKPKETSERKKDILEKERRRDRELVDAKFKDNDDKRRDQEKEKRRKDPESHEKLNGDHIDCMFDGVEDDHDQKDTSKKDKKKEHRVNSWPASIGCKRRLSSQDSDLAEDSKRSKQERRDSKDSSKSSGSSKKGEKHSKSFSRTLEERIKEEKEHDKKKDDLDGSITEEKHKKQLKKEKKNEKKKEDKKYKARLKENGTASESDLNSGDEEVKNMKRQHSIFDIVDDEPAYISMYDKVKARSTKNMQKQEEEKRQEKLKEKFNQLKQSRAKREEKKRSTSYDEDSDSERGGGGHNRRSNKLMITSSEEDNGSECDIKMTKNKKLTFDFSEDDSMLVTPKSKLIKSHNQDHENKTRKILSDTSEDDILRHSTPKIKPKVTIELEMKSRKIMSDTSEDDNLKSISRIKASRIQSDESENEIISYNVAKEVDSDQHLVNSTSDDIYSKRDFPNHNSVKNVTLDTNFLRFVPSPTEEFNMLLEELPRKKKKQKKQKNFDDGDGTSSKKHSSKKDKKKSHNKDDDDTNCKKSKKKKDRDCNKREEKIEDIFGTLSDDSDKALMRHVNKFYRTDSDSEHETIRKKEKRRREKKARELDEAGRALEANLMDPNESYQVVEPVKNKKKKRKKSRDEKIKHHHSESLSLDQRIEEERRSFLDGYMDYKSQQNIRQSIDREMKIREKEEDGYGSEEFTKENRYNEESQQRIEEEAIESILPPNSDSEDLSSKVRPQSMATLLDSPPHVQHTHQTKKIEIPGFRGIGVDEDIHETAVKSISESSNNSIQINEPKFEPEKAEQASSDDKPTPVISQEETEDAVAALLMEDTFGGTSGEFDSFTEDTPKPDTPASEPDLQIDTDAEETYDIDISKPPRTPDIPQSFYQRVDTREGLEERILPLVCSSDTPVKEEIKVLEVPRTPGSSLERAKTEEAPSPDIHPVKLNLDTPEKLIKEDLKQSDPLALETNLNSKNNSFESVKVLESAEVEEEETTTSPKGNVETIIKPEVPEIKESVCSEPAPRNNVITDPVKKEISQPSSLDHSQSSLVNSFVTNAKSPSALEANSVAEPVIKQTPSSVLTKVTKEVENPTDVIISNHDVTPNIPSGESSKPVSSTTTQIAAALKQPNIQNFESPASNLHDMEVMRINVSGSGQSRMHSPATIVQQTDSSPPCVVRPQLHFQPTLHTVPSSLGLVRTSPIQTHPISTQTRPSVCQVRHLSMIPTQPVRSPGSPHLLQHGLTPKPVTHVIQQPSNNPVIRHAVSSNVQQVKPPATAIVVSQPNIQRQLQLVTQASPLSPQNLKLIRSDRPNSPINIVRLVRPVMPNQCLPVSPSVPLIQSASASSTQIKPVIPPLHEVKGPPSLVAIPDKHVIQHTVSHMSTPVNVIRNSPSEFVKISEPTITEEHSDKSDKDAVGTPEMKELPLKSSATTDVSTESTLPSDSKTAISSMENTLNSVEQNSQLNETKPLNDVIHDLTSKAIAKQVSDEEPAEKPNKIELVIRELQQRIKTVDSKDQSPNNNLPISEDVVIKQEVDEDTPSTVKLEESVDVKCTKIDQKEVIPVDVKLKTEEPVVKEEKPEMNHKEIKEEVLVDEKDESCRKEDIKCEELSDTKDSKDLESVDEIPEDKPMVKGSIVDSPVNDAPVEKTVIVKDTVSNRGRKRKRKVRSFGPVRRANKNNIVPPVKTSTDVYEFRDDSEEERPRLILTIKSPPDRSEPPIKIKATPTTRKSRRLQEKDGGKTPIEEVLEGVVRSTNRPGRRATRSTQPHLTVSLNPEPRKSPRRKQTRPPTPIDEKPIKIESPPTPPPTPAAPSTPATPIIPTSVPPIPPTITAPVSTPSAPVLTPSVPPTPPLSATPPASSPPASALPPTAPSTPAPNTPVTSSPAISTPTPTTPVISTPVITTPVTSTPVTSTAITSTPVTSTPVTCTPVTSTPVTSTPVPSTPVPSTPVTSTPKPSNPAPISTVPSTPASTVPAHPIIPSTTASSLPKSSPPVSCPSTSSSPLLAVPTPPVITTTTATTPSTPSPSASLSATVKVVSKPVPTSTTLPLQSSVPNAISTNSLQNRNLLEPTTLIDPVTGLLIPMQESEEGQYIPLHSDLNRVEGEPSKKRLRIHAEVTRPSVVRQVLPPSTVSISHNSQSQVCQQPQVSQHQPQLQQPVCQPKVTQHQTCPPLQTQVVQQPVPQHQAQVPPQHQVCQPQHQVCQIPPQPHVSQHQVCQTQTPKAQAQLQSLATVTPVHISHPPPPLMPVSTPHHPPVGSHIQSSVQMQNISKATSVSKPTPLATVTVSTPKIVVTKTEPSSLKPVYQPSNVESSIGHTSVVHSVPVTGGVHTAVVPSVVHTSAAGVVSGVHGSVLQGNVPLVGGVMAQRHVVQPAPAHSPALNPAPAHSPALHPAPAHSPVHPTPAHHPLVVRSVAHGLNPPAAHMHHAHAVHTPAAHAVHTPSSHIPSAHAASHADSLRAVPSPAPGAPPGLPVACKPAPINPKTHLLQAVRPRASPSPAHAPPPKAHIHQPITNIRDGSLVSSAGPLGASISSPPLRAAHQQPPTHLPNPPPSSPRVVVKGPLGGVERAREACHAVTSPQPRPSHVQPGLPMLAYEPSLGDVVQHYVSAHMQPAHYVHSQLMYQQWMGSNNSSSSRAQGQKEGASSPPLELRRPTPPRSSFYETPPPAHSRPSQPRLHTPPHASQVPPQADSLLMLLQRHPVMWQGLLALKNDQAAVQMHFVFGNANVARNSLPCNRDGSTPPLRIAQRMRLEQAQIEGVSRKMQSDTEHCMLLALPCGRDHMDVLQQSNNLQSCFITYLQQKQAAGIVNIAVSGSQQPAYVIHIFPSCEFANESLARIAPDLMHRVADIAHLLIVIATV